MESWVCEGKHVRLRVVDPQDAERVAAWKRDPLVREMALGRSTVATEEEERADIRSALDSESQLYCLIVVRQTSRPAGYVRINWMDGEHLSAWLRFALGEERGRGYAKEALAVFLDHLFAGGAHRVEAEVYETNRVSRGLLEGLGFSLEGTKREAHLAESGWVDVLVLGLLEGELTAGGGGAT
jgi:RimJ/RimL family protein N-acetyltransferase